MKLFARIILLLLVVNLWTQDRNAFIDDKLEVVSKWNTNTKSNTLKSGVLAIINECIKEGFSSADLAQLNEYYKNQIKKTHNLLGQGKFVKNQMTIILNELKNKNHKKPSTPVTIAKSKPAVEIAAKKQVDQDKTELPSSSTPEDNTYESQQGDLENFGRGLAVPSKQEQDGQDPLPLNVLEASDLKLQVEKMESRVTLMEDSMNSLHNWALALLLGWVIAAGLILVFLVALRLQAKRVAELEFHLKRLASK